MLWEALGGPSSGPTNKDRSGLSGILGPMEGLFRILDLLRATSWLRLLAKLFIRTTCELRSAFLLVASPKDMDLSPGRAPVWPILEYPCRLLYP